MTEQAIAIIRLNTPKLHRQPLDIVRLRELGIAPLEYLIPLVKVLKGKLKGEIFFEEKPLLLNYGFMRIPKHILTERESMSTIIQHSEVLQGFFYRAKEDVKRDMERYEEAQSQAKEEGVNSSELFHKPILVQTIKQEQVDVLFKVARSMDNFQNTEELQIGSYVILQNYPFSGLSAMVLEKRGNGKVKLELIESGLIVTQEFGSLIYTLNQDYLYDA